MRQLKKIVFYPLHGIDWGQAFENIVWIPLTIVGVVCLALVISILIVVIPVGGYHVIEAAIQHDWKWIFLLLFIYPDIGVIHYLCKRFDNW